MARQEVTQEQRNAVVAAIRSTVVRNEDLLKINKISREAFEQIVLNAIAKDARKGSGQLALCSPSSFVTAVSECIAANIMPDGVGAALIPRWSSKNGCLEANYDLMVAGMLMKAREALPDVAIQAHSVFVDVNDDEFGDEFIVTMGTSPEIVHKPDPEVEHSNENLFAVYATAHHPSNPIAEFEVMYRGEIDKFKDFSKAKGGPWSGPWMERQAQARPLRRLLKRLRITSSLRAMLGDEDEGFFVEDDTDGTVGAETIDPPADTGPGTIEGEAEVVQQETQQEAPPADPPKRQQRRRNTGGGGRGTRTRQQPAQTQQETQPVQQADPADDYSGVEW